MQDKAQLIHANLTHDTSCFTGSWNSARAKYSHCHVIKPVRNLFIGSRQRPTHDTEHVEDLGLIDLPGTLQLLRSIDWRQEVAQSEWAKKALPTLAVTNQHDDCTVWTSAWLPKELVDVKADPDPSFHVDPGEPWFSVGITNAPNMRNLVSLEPHGSGDSSEFTTFSIERAEECFRWFFESDYLSLYEIFRWS